MSALSPERPYSEENPYHMAIYLHSLIKAAMYIVKDLPPPFAASTGLDGLMAIIEERADALSSVLDVPAQRAV